MARAGPVMRRAQCVRVGDYLVGWGRVVSVMRILPTSSFAGKITVQFPKHWVTYRWNEEVIVDA